MAQSKKEIESLLAGRRPRHRFGQNFMIDANLVRAIVAAGEVRSTDTVIEVGPGTGTLTEELLAIAGRVIAIEIDRDLSAVLRQRFSDRPNFELIEGDALDGKHAISGELKSRMSNVECRMPNENRDPAFDIRHSSFGIQAKLISNLPYNIASPLVIELLLEGVELLVFTVQLEVAQRLKAVAGEDAFGPISVMANLLGRVEILKTIGRDVFWPRPAIDSALVRIRRDDRIGPDAREFGTFVQRLFAFRRKTLKRALAECGIEHADLLDIEPTLRPEVIAGEDLLRLFRANRPRPESSDS